MSTNAPDVQGGADGALRMWPLTFEKYFLAAEHDAPVTSVALSVDGCVWAIAEYHRPVVGYSSLRCRRLSVLASTADGKLGILDVSQRAYRNIAQVCAVNSRWPLVVLDAFLCGCFRATHRH